MRDNATPGRVHAGVRAHGGRPGRGRAVHRGRNPAPVLVMEGVPEALLRQAQDHRREPPARVFDLRPPFMDLGSGQREPSRQLLPRRFGVLETMDPGNWMGDKGYVGNDMITPFKKPQGGELLDWQKEFNTGVNKIRWMIEQAISHFKNWKITSTDDAVIESGALARGGQMAAVRAWQAVPLPGAGPGGGGPAAGAERGGGRPADG